MANATRMIKITRADYERLITDTSVSIIINGHTVKYDPNAVYLIEEEKVLSYIEI